MKSVPMSGNLIQTATSFNRHLDMISFFLKIGQKSHRSDIGDGHMNRLLVIGIVTLGGFLLCPTNGSATEPQFGDYPAKKYSAKTLMPNFNGAQREYRNYRTRIREGFKKGPNFAGAYSVIEIGCGTGCRWILIGANRTGEILSFPRGGEENLSLELEHQLSSRLLIAQWTDYKKCMREYFLFDGESFDVLETREMPTTEYGMCLTPLKE